MDHDETERAGGPTYSQQPTSNVGYVYCLSNPAMPALVKIGFSNRTP